MPDPWLPGALRRPGALAGYARGTTRMQFAVEHFTVGTDSTGIGDRGYFHLLFPKVGPPLQFAEIDALTWHAGPWNSYGPGAEFERLGYDEPLTADQLEWGGRYHHWLSSEWGIPLVHFRGPPDGTRFDPSEFHGFPDHGAIDDQRTDGVTDAEFAPMAGLAPPVFLSSVHGGSMIYESPSGVRLLDWPVFTGVSQDDLASLRAQGVPYLKVSEDFANYIQAAVDRDLHGASGGGGLSEAQARAVVRDELDKTKLATG